MHEYDKDTAFIKDILLDKQNRILCFENYTVTKYKLPYKKIYKI